MRRKIVAGNWKMNQNFSEGLTLLENIVQLAKSKDIQGVQFILFPSFIHLQAVSENIATHTDFFTGAQNCAAYQNGAYTGEVSASMIASTGATYVIIGHSERRFFYHEDNAEVLKKIRQALGQHLQVVFCCGESLDQREEGIHFNFIHQQLDESVFRLEENDFHKIIIAYEPIWAIGTGKTASGEQAQEMHAYIREKIRKRYGEKTALQTNILYGGSCKPDNASSLFACPDVDGGLIGGASLNAEDFIQIAMSF